MLWPQVPLHQTRSELFAPSKGSGQPGQSPSIGLRMTCFWEQGDLVAVNDADEDDISVEERDDGNGICEGLDPAAMMVAGDRLGPGEASESE